MSLPDNGVDGESFLLLTEPDLSGIRRKLIVKLNALKKVDKKTIEVSKVFSLWSAMFNSEGNNYYPMQYLICS